MPLPEWMHFNLASDAATADEVKIIQSYAAENAREESMTDDEWAAYVDDMWNSRG